MKLKTIRLDTWEQAEPRHGQPPAMVRRWRVLQVTDSIEHSPLQELGKGQVEELCAAKNWKVTIVERKA